MLMLVKAEQERAGDYFFVSSVDIKRCLGLHGVQIPYKIQQ